MNRTRVSVPFGAAVLAFAGACSAATPDVFDCRADRGTCPALVIADDPPAKIPEYGLAPFRGYGDPSLRRDPRTGTLWLSYSWVATIAAPSLFGPVIDIGVVIHLARSDDGGHSFRYVGTIWDRDDRPYEGRKGYAGHEVSTITPTHSGWAALDLRYFNPRGHGNDFVPDSLHFELITAAEPALLSSVNETRLGGPLTAAVWRPFIDLSKISGKGLSCPLWTEPSLFEENQTLYLLAQCKTPADPTRGFLGLFAQSAQAWRWIGELTRPADARALGGNELTQADLVRGRAGDLQLLVTPNIVSGSTERHLGCLVIRVSSLDPPALQRDVSGAPVVQARIVSSDSVQNGPGACAYEPTSATGVLVVRRELSPAGGVIFSIHATDMHP